MLEEENEQICLWVSRIKLTLLPKGGKRTD